jgi:hypothetical protein
MFGKKKLTPKEQAREVKKEVRHNEVGAWVRGWLNGMNPSLSLCRFLLFGGWRIIQHTHTRMMRPSSDLHTCQRDLERELWNLGREETKLIAEIKKEAAKGATQKTLKTMAGNLVQVLTCMRVLGCGFGG